MSLLRSEFCMGLSSKSGARTHEPRKAAVSDGRKEGAGVTIAIARLNKLE